MNKITINWTEYLRYRADIRGYNLLVIEDIIRYSKERYFDISTRRMVAIGKHDERTVIIPYEETPGIITPVTIHAITRQQIKYRIKSGRLLHE